MSEMLKKLIAAALAVMMAGCGAHTENVLEPLNPEDVPRDTTVISSNGFAEGRAGDTMRTAFFDFTVSGAEFAETYGETVKPSAGMKLLVVNMSVTGTFDKPVHMYDSDFQVQWGKTGDEDFAVPVTYETNKYTEGMLEPEYDLMPGQTVSGDLVYEVPEGYENFFLAFQEYFEDEGLGDAFFVDFSAGPEH